MVSNSLEDDKCVKRSNVDACCFVKEKSNLLTELQSQRLEVVVDNCQMV